MIHHCYTKIYIPLNIEYDYDYEPVHVTNECNQIFTAWMYEKPIPDTVLMNIVTLAQQNLNMTLSVHVSCGSAQCVSAIRDWKLHNMEVEFAVINEIVDELPPLKEWWTRQSLNKILAGKKFEDHLQEVTILGYLWKHGRFYVNPALSMNATLSIKCSNDTSTWFSKRLSPENTQSSLTVLLHSFLQNIPSSIL